MNYIAQNKELEKAETYLKNLSNYLKEDYEKRGKYFFVGRLSYLMTAEVFASFLLLGVIWLDSVQPYPTITNIFLVLFIFGFTYISSIFFFHKVSDLKHYGFFKKRFLKKNKSLINTMLSHYNLTIDDVNIDYKNLEISYKSHNLNNSKNGN